MIGDTANPEMLPRHTLLQGIMTSVNATNHKYSTLMKPGINPQPIPYFGDPLTARVATFGVNPSATELTWARWPMAGLTWQQLDARLVNYFRNPAAPPHPWFDAYERVFKKLSHSYRTDAVHLDLSSRATKSMGSVDPKAFIEMVVADMGWFLSALALAKNLKAAIMSGSVTKKYYFDEFLRAHLPPSHRLTLRQALETKPRGATALYDLVGPGFKIPVFFVGTSPSSRTGGTRFVSEVDRNLAALQAAGFKPRQRAFQALPDAG